MIGAYVEKNLIIQEDAKDRSRAGRPPRNDRTFFENRSPDRLAHSPRKWLRHPQLSNN